MIRLFDTVCLANQECTPQNYPNTFLAFLIPCGSSRVSSVGLTRVVNSAHPLILETEHDSAADFENIQPLRKDVVEMREETRDATL